MADKGTGAQASAGAADDGEARYERLREAYWLAASIEGLTLGGFVDRTLGEEGSGATVLALLTRLVEDVEDTVLRNIALKAEEEGGMYEALADERIEEVQAERAELLDRLREAASGR